MVTTSPHLPLQVTSTAREAFLHWQLMHGVEYDTVDAVVGACRCVGGRVAHCLFIGGRVARHLITCLPGFTPVCLLRVR